jgi:hypothetical protein
MTESRNSENPARQPLRQLAWEEISEPGAYVDIATGTLYRIPREALREGAAPFGKQDTARSQFFQVSKNPFIFPLGARLVCAAHNIQPKF